MRNAPWFFTVWMGILLSLFLTQQSQADSGIALVYSGPGACIECVEAAATVAEKAGLQVRLVDAEMIQPSLFRGAVVWIQPGGNAITMGRRIGPRQMQLLRQFIGKQGGGYLGFCAGGFFTDRWVNNSHTIAGLTILPVSSYDYSRNKHPQVLHINWQGQARDMYYENGPSFDEPGELASVVARYPDHAVAAMFWHYGAGAVAVSGPHPEAPSEWFSSEHLVRGDGLATDQDLAVALLKSVLPNANGRALSCSNTLY